MAKQNTPSNQGKGTTSVVTNSFIKGMNKDITQSMEPAQSWWHARNAANNSNDGDMGVIGNEPANLQCGVIPYTIIGAVHRYGDEWIVFSTDDINSEIGRFDDSECKYTTLVNDPCLAFNRMFLITGASKENFDCTWQVYWDDANNPSRSLNIDDIPWKQEVTSATGDVCVTYSNIVPPELNCEKIRLAPLVDTPCIELTKATDGGMLQNGAYQAFVAYTENEQKVTDYIGISNVQTLWSHKGTDGSLNIDLSNLDKDFEFFELALLVRNQGQTYAKRIGLYSTERTSINLDYIDDSLVSVDLKVIPQRSPAYEKSEAMYVVNDWLLRQGPTEQFDFNYQPIANNIKCNFVINTLPASYYHNAGNKLGFLRDEQYAFFIRWIYNTGERSSSYHIPGRAPVFYGPAGLNEDQISTNANALDPSGDPVFKIWNTGGITSVAAEIQSDGSMIVARGDMGYWESTERYPSNRPDIWGDLCGKPIRHHKMPSEDGGGSSNNALHLTDTSGDLINVLGVEFTNIGRPKNNDGSYITNVVGYELLKGSRGGAKSILGKGLFRNMRKYEVPTGEDLLGNTQGLYPNYPYNDLRPDVYFHDGKNAGVLNRTDGCDNFPQSVNSFKPLGVGVDSDGEPSGYSRSVFTFSSPDLMFTKPFLNAYETRIYGDLSGKQTGSFKASEDHPQFKLLRSGAAVISAIIGIGYAVNKVQGDRSMKRTGASAVVGSPVDWTAAVGTGNTYTGVAYGIYNVSAGIKLGAVNAATAFYANGASAAALGDLWLGGTLMSAANQAYQYTTSAFGIGGAGTPGTYDISDVKNTALSNLPPTLRIPLSILTTGTNIAIGGNEIIELIYNLINKSDFVYKYNSLGQFDTFTKRNTGLWRIQNTDSNYIGQSFQSFDSGKYKINNLFRPSTVVVSLKSPIAIPSVQDKSRFVIGGEINSGGTGIPYSDNYLLDPTVPQKRNISAYYGALKYNFDNQYGQLDGIKQIPMRSCVNYLDSEKPDAFMYSSLPIFQGDVFINRYTEKVIMPIFAQYLLGQPDEFTYDYSNHVNIPYPRYWLDSQKFDMTKLANKIATLGLVSSGSLSALFPGDLFYLDRGDDSCGGSALSSVFGGSNSDPNPVLAMRYGYMYTHSNGILDFFVESEVNLANRDWEDTKAKRIYDIYEYNDLTELFHAQIEGIDNFYKYDESLSPSRFPSQLSSWGQMQPRYYDPYVAENCYVSRPKRLIYSLQAQHESKKDFWRVFLNFNYKDFKNAVSVIKPINKSGAIVFFPYLSPQMFQGLDTLKTGLDTKITIGDGGLFSQPFQNITNSDLSNEYGSCESLRSVMNTPMGLFYISQAQGKIFHYAGSGLDPISNKGMKWWFNKYLPSQLVKQFPELEYSVLSDNAVVGVGCQTIYDPNDDIVYFMKKDYRAKSNFNISYNEIKGFMLNGIVPITLGDPIYFDDASWTISYDPKAKAWISFHDWHPEFALPSINHFFTTKTIETTIPQCPPGYNFNPTTGLCEISNTATELSTVNVEELVATVTGGSADCLIDIIVAMDVSGSTNTDGRRQAQQAWLTSFLNDADISGPMGLGTMQVGFTAWAGGNINYNIPNGSGSTWTMSNTVTEPQVTSWYNTNWIGGGTVIPQALAAAQNRINLKVNSQLGDRSTQPFFKQIIIFITDTTTAPAAGVGCQYQAVGVSPTSSGPANQNVFALYCGAGSSVPPAAGVLNAISCTTGPVNVDPYQYGINASDSSTFPVVASAIASAVCAIPFECNCPAGYTKVFINATTNLYTESTGVCDDIIKPVCRKVSCSCPPSPFAGATTTITGVCPDSAPKIFQLGDPSWVDPTPQVCDYFYLTETPPNYKVGSFWRHNSRCDLFANYYGEQFPWEVDLVANTGQAVNTVRSMEYQLESYVYKNDPGYLCGDDKWEDLHFNFDQAVVYNNEQVSGLLELVPTPFNNPILELTYPIINTNNINILCSKVEQKFRFNQFWDITNDRGEFPGVGGVVTQQPIWDTSPNGYIKNLNSINLNYFKSPLQHKKFRHYFTNVILRKVDSGSRKMLLRLNNSKLLTSLR